MKEYKASVSVEIDIEKLQEQERNGVEIMRQASEKFIKEIQDMGGKFIGQVHDELLFELPKDINAASLVDKLNHIDDVEK